MTPWIVLTLGGLAAIMPGAEECRRLEEAHRAFLGGSFTCERHFTVKLNGDLKARTVTRLTYGAGTLTRETLDHEVLDANIVLDEGEGEGVLDLPFDCDRLVRLEDDLFELVSADGTERVVFVWERATGRLRPRRWDNHETERFLWKKLVIEAAAEYRRFEWR